MSVIYKPKGKAGEYASLALNIFKGCDHGCLYPCYAPSILKMTREEFGKVQIRPDLINQLLKELPKYSGTDEPILLCFTSDPYNKWDQENEFTRQVLEMFMDHDVPVSILTKGGARARRDFDILAKMRHVEFGQTILFDDDRLRQKWEPGASPIGERIGNLKVIKSHPTEMGHVRTWVSLEPMIDLAQAVDLIDRYHPLVDHWKVGRWNYHADSKAIDWGTWGKQIEHVLQYYHCDYYIKEDLRKAM